MRSLALLSLLSAGCLGSAHFIPKGELAAISHQAPGERGERVRVVQGYVGDEHPRDGSSHHGGGAHGEVHVHGGGGRGGGGARVARGGARPSNAAKLNVDDARVLLVAAAALTVGLAATQGSRYSGWVNLHPEHPIHLLGPHGEYLQVPLADLDPELATWARKAYVRPEDGTFEKLERAPLERRGITWAMLAGPAQIGGAGGIETGFMSHMQLGYFATQELGLVVDLGMGWRGADEDDTVYELRAAGELQVYPFAVGRLHAGGYGQLGTGYRSDDGAGRDSQTRIYGAGALLQLDITTYLALTGRAGVVYAFGDRTSELGIGLAIY